VCLLYSFLIDSKLNNFNSSNEVLHKLVDVFSFNDLGTMNFFLNYLLKHLKLVSNILEDIKCSKFPVLVGIVIYIYEILQV